MCGTEGMSASRPPGRWRVHPRR